MIVSVSSFTLPEGSSGLEGRRFPTFRARAGVRNQATAGARTRLAGSQSSTSTAS
jgi:hypothetical protein